MKNRTRRILLTSTLIAGITLSVYGVFARAQAATRLASVPPRAPVKGTARAGSAAQPAASQTTARKGVVPAVRASYSNLADGNYVGASEFAYYGYVKVEVIVQNGSVSNVRVLEHPNDNGTSRYINSIAVPYLVQEAVQAQSARIDLISGATFTSVAFARSLQSALLKAASA